MGVHSGVTKRIELALFARIFSDSQGAPGIGHMVGKFQVDNAKRRGELTQAAFQLWQPLARNTVGNGSSPWRCFWVQLKAAPINFYHILILQPDQAALLRYEAVRSYKVRIQSRNERPGVSCFLGFHNYGFSLYILV